MKITIGDSEFTAILYENETVQALTVLLPMTIVMNELNNNEKYYYLPTNLPTSATSPSHIQAGDIMLYGSNCLVLFYKTFQTSYSYTKIGKVQDTQNLLDALGSEIVTVTISMIENNKGD